MTGLEPLVLRSSSGALMHVSVGAVIERHGRYLLIDRLSPPFGYAGLAGHVDAGELPAQALMREIREESGLIVTLYELLVHEVVAHNACKRGVAVHDWYVYRCTVVGEAIWNSNETKSIGWYTPHQLMRLPLEPVWKVWFEKAGVFGTTMLSQP